MKIIKQWQVHALINAEKKNSFFMLVTHVKYTFFVNNLIRPFHTKTKNYIYIYFWIQKKHFFKEKFLKMRRKHTNITIKTTPLCLSLPTHTCILAMAYIMTKKSLQHSHAFDIKIKIDSKLLSCCAVEVCQPFTEHKATRLQLLLDTPTLPRWTLVC